MLSFIIVLFLSYNYYLLTNIIIELKIKFSSINLKNRQIYTFKIQIFAHTFFHSHITKAISAVCVDTNRVDFPWHCGTSIATHIGGAEVASCLHWTQWLLLAYAASVSYTRTLAQSRNWQCPEGCNVTSPRFNVNLILSLMLWCYCQHNRQEGEHLIKDVHCQTHITECNVI